MSESIKSLFSSISPTYDRANHLLSLNADRRWRRKTIRKIGGDKTRSFKALDLCAGTLDLSIEFLERFPRGEVWALDFSQKMLEHGMAKIRANGPKGPLQHRLHTVCADGLNMPFSTGQFDVVFCGFGFRNFDDRKTALKEIHRVLKPEGQLLILEFFRPTNFITRLFHKTYGNFVLPLAGGLISGRKEAYRYLHRSIADFYSLEECKELFRQSGFETTEAKNFSLGVCSLIAGKKPPLGV
ncbi:MAG: bifunctional demethylmenaquinone methyltransferase/2-methoxy-6-polyprenyl-1,4-benzoquinol methylase UbiE [Deltaproteobacteria bacterium]|nr:bifunctional demethylmenaquinone methyltransferase/2-methoxy-6-polyprenyl-1,4-benzoquinol methylase UbiE [Deltaproteobacteria bacterium]